jgi:D-alanine-D-alanine ligase
MKKRIAILRGGPSSEYDVSLKTGKSVLDSLRDDHHVLDIVIDKNGDWYLEGKKREPKDALKNVDGVFNAMHGEYGEDGKVQQLLEQIKVQ